MDSAISPLNKWGLMIILHKSIKSSVEFKICAQCYRKFKGSASVLKSSNIPFTDRQLFLNLQHIIAIIVNLKQQLLVNLRICDP